MRQTRHLGDERLMLIGWIGLASAQTPLPEAIRDTEAEWNQAWESRDRSRLEELLSPDFSTMRLDRRQLLLKLKSLGEDEAAWNRMASTHATKGCSLAAVIEIDLVHTEAVLACPNGWSRVQYDRPDEETLTWQRGKTAGFTSKPPASEFLAGHPRYAWHLIETDDEGWGHYRSAGAAGVRLSVRKTDGTCPHEVALASPSARPSPSGLTVSISPDVGVRSTATACTVYALSPEPAGLPCEPCRVEEGIRLVQLLDRLRWVEPGVTGELARAALRRSPKFSESLYQMVSLGRPPDDAVLLTETHAVAREGKIVAVERGPVTLLDESLRAEGLVRGPRNAPTVWGARELGEGRFAITVPLDVAASATEDWVRSLGIEDVEVLPQDSGSLQFATRDGIVAEVLPFEQGSLLRFSPFGPVPTPQAVDPFRALLNELPPSQVRFRLPVGVKAVPPLWVCPLDVGCATAATLVAKGRRAAVPEAWLGTMEACWSSARPVSQVLTPESTLKVKSRFGTRVLDFAGDRARTEGRVYASGCLLDESQRLATWMTLHDAHSAIASGKEPRSLVDAWGGAIRVEGSGTTAVLVSFGEDGVAGGQGYAKDLRYPPTE